MRDIDNGIKAKLLKRDLTRASGNQVDFRVYIGRSKEFIQSDADYFVELIRKKSGVTDIEVVPRRMKPLRNPDKLFDVHLDNGIITTATRNYVKRDGEEWQDQFQLGRGLACSICFDGRWTSKRGKWMLLTEEVPWVFYVDESKRLWAQAWNKTTERLQLSADVVKVKSIRGWKSVNFRELDLGVVALYLKTDGKLYYRNYCEQSDGRFIWENEREFSEETATNFNLFETNDYRIGVTVTNALGRTKVYLSKRNWAGMGIRGEFLNVQVSEKIELRGLDYWDAYEREYLNIDMKEQVINGYRLTDNKLLHVYNENDGSGDFGKYVIFGTDNDCYNLKGSDFKITDSRGVSAYAYEVEYIGRGLAEKRYPFLYRAKYQNLNNFRGECTAEILGATTQNAVGQAYPHMSMTFTPTGLRPVEVPPPKVIEVRNENDNKIILTFDRAIVGGAEESQSVFKLTSIAYKTTNTKEIVEDRHDIKMMTLSEDRMIITFELTDETRIRRAKTFNVAYMNGSMVGEAEPVANFEMMFQPTGIPYVNDIGECEYINIEVQESIQNMKIDYVDVAKKYGEYIDVNVSESIEYKSIDNVNP